MRSRPRAMPCDALVRRELGSCCVDLDVSMFCGLQDDRRAASGAQVALSWPVSGYVRAHAVTMTGIKIRVPMGSMSHLTSSPLLAAPT